MRIERTFDPDLVKAVFTRPEIWATVAEDGLKAEDFEPDFGRTAYLYAVEGELIGTASMRPVNSVCLEFHAQILMKHRGVKAREAVTGFLKWIYDNAPQYGKLVIFVPVCYKNVRLFAGRLGFKKEGLNRASYRKDGVTIDQWLLGITRAEIEELVNVGHR